MTVIVNDDPFAAGTWPYQWDGGSASHPSEVAGIVGAEVALECGANEYVTITSGLTLPAGLKILCGRLYFTIHSDAAGTDSLVQGATANGNFQIQQRNLQKIRAQLGGTVNSVELGPLTLDTLHWVDYLFDSSNATTAKLDWALDGAAQTQLTKAQATAAFSELRNGTSGGNASAWRIALPKVTTSAADYPLGLIPATALPSAIVI